MGDVITWSKLNKIKKLISNLPTSLENNFNGVKESISALANNFNTWKAPWTTARAEKIDTVTDNSKTIKSTMAKDATVAKQSTLNIVNNTVGGLGGAINTINTNTARGVIKKIQSIQISGAPTLGNVSGVYTSVYNISPVNPQKSFVVGFIEILDYQEYIGGSISLVGNNQVIIKSQRAANWRDCYGEIRVIEFY